MYPQSFIGVTTRRNFIFISIGDQSHNKTGLAYKIIFSKYSCLYLKQTITELRLKIKFLHLFHRITAGEYA